MHSQAADAIVESVRRREAQGDCPTEPAQSVETLENCILELARRGSGSTVAPLDQPTPHEVRALHYPLSALDQSVAAGSTGGAPTRAQIEAMLLNILPRATTPYADGYREALERVLALFGAASRVPSESPDTEQKP